MSTPISYSLKMASAATGLSETYLKARIGDGSLRAKRSGKDPKSKKPTGKYLVLASELEAFVAELESA